MIIADGMGDTWNPVNGRHYDSKSQYYKAVKASGCEIIGNEKQKPAPRPEMPDIEADVAREWQKLQAKAPKTRKKRKHRGI
tara:strand:- start:114 stop:356 length:243 start_codon:yes stop_codon:yes gene_type:complete